MILWGVLLGCFFCCLFEGSTLYTQQVSDFFGGFLCLGFLVDSTRLSFGGVVGLVRVVVYFYRLGYIGGDQIRRKFFRLVFIFVRRMFILIFSGDLLTIFLGWEGLGVSSFLLVIYYRNHARVSSGIITIIRNRVGDVFFLLGLGSLYMGGEVRFLFSEAWGCGFFFFACVAKRAQWPLCGWLPAAIAAPTPVSALVHSSTLVTAGGYLLFRFEGVELIVLDSLLLIPLTTILLARLGALVRYDLKRLVAISTLRHIALICWAILGGYERLAFFHLVIHALFKSLLFLCAGVLIQGAGHSQDIRLMGGSFERHLICKIGLLYSRVRIIGLPLLGGYDSKELVMGGILLSGIQNREFSFLLGRLIMFFRGGYAFRLIGLLLMRKKVALFGHNNSRVSLNCIGVLLLISVILGKWGYFYRSLGITSLLGLLEPSWFSLFISGLLVDFWLRGEDYNAWYEVGELGRMRLNLRISCLHGCLRIREEVEIGWLEGVGGEGILKTGKGICNVTRNNEW